MAAVRRGRSLPPGTAARGRQGARTAAFFRTLTAGYAGPRTASTASLVRDGDTVVVDPGMVADRTPILDPSATEGVAPDRVTDVVFSHHHPDHTLSAALFPAAGFHDHGAVCRDDLWTDRPADGFRLSRSIRPAARPVHTPEDSGCPAAPSPWWPPRTGSSSCTRRTTRRPPGSGAR
ncbi:MBL fold metallo-hydrolase [Streptomyces antibioticus]|uniref:MBL fold metallo-hydrolase n=1 Tax=Streptomyces antibioticus TaxID=1890 RepID=UPI0033D3549D